MLDPIKITVYQWAGEKWGIHIRTECMECDFTVAQVRGLLSSHPDWPVELEIKPWLNHVWEALRRGGWQAPAVLVHGRLFSQGKVPHRAALQQAIENELAARGSETESFWRRLKRALPPEPS